MILKSVFVVDNEIFLPTIWIYKFMRACYESFRGGEILLVVLDVTMHTNSITTNKPHLAKYKEYNSTQQTVEIIIIEIQEP